MVINESIHQEGITTLSEYAPHNRVSKYMKQKLTELKGGRDISTILTGDCNTKGEDHLNITGTASLLSGKTFQSFNK